MAINLLEWPGIWFGIFFKPGKTAERLKSEKLGFEEGIISMLLASFLLGLAAFIILAVLWGVLGSALGGLGGGLGFFGMGLVMIFIMCVLLLPLSCVVILLISVIILKIASILLKGRGSISSECGYLGVVGSSGLIFASIFYALLIVLMILSVGVGGAGMMTGNFGFALGGFYILMGVAMLPFSVLMFIYTAFFLDMLAYVEEVSIYRSGAIIGLCYGISMMLMLVMFGLFMMAVMQMPFSNQNTQLYPNYFRYT